MSKDNLVLLVEDDPDTREIMAILLEGAGYEVLSARDATSGLKLIEEAPHIGTVVTDVNIGGGQDGISMAEEIRARGCDAAVVVVSGDPEASSGRLGASATFLPKPYDRKALLAAIADAHLKHAHAMAHCPTQGHPA